MLREKEEELRNAKDEISFVSDQVEQVRRLLEQSNDERSQLAHDNYRLRLETEQVKKDYEAKIRGIKAGHEKQIHNLKFEIKRLNDVFDTYKECVAVEYKLKDAIIDKLDTSVTIFKENGRRMRAVLRVPRLTKQYHDMVRGEEMAEFACLDEVYERHYGKVAEELGLTEPGDKTSAQDATLSSQHNPLISVKDQEAQYRRMSVAEQ